MSNLSDKAQRYHSSIREILLKEWDPIGVGHLNEAEDEYDAYVTEVYRLVSRRATANQILDYLWWVETEHMALCGDRQRTEKIAERLATLPCQIED